jgi:hypothetical protein
LGTLLKTFPVQGVVGTKPLEYAHDEQNVSAVRVEEGLSYGSDALHGDPAVEGVDQVIAGCRIHARAFVDDELLE